MEAKARKGTVTVLYTYAYNNRQDRVSMKEGERLILMDKTSSDWWQVRRPGDSRAFYAPANYLQEDGFKSRMKQSAMAGSPSKQTSTTTLM